MLRPMRARHDGTVPLDTSFVETRIAELGLKQYWLADQLGVSPRTVLRWVNGQVRRIQHEHLAPLAHHLRCREDQLSPPASAAVVDEDARAEAARLLTDEDIVGLLTPSASYPMAEALLKASLSPGLAPHTQGKLYNMLAVVVGRQFRIAEAIDYASRAEAIGRELDNQVIVVGAWYGIGWARLYAGEIEVARELFQRCVDALAYLDQEHDAGMAWFGLGSCQAYAGDTDTALASLATAIARLEPHGRPVDLSMPLYVEGAILLGAGRLDAAHASLTRSRELASRVGFSSGIGRATAALAEVAARRGAIADGVALYAQALDCFAGSPFVHPAVFVSGARVLQLAGDLSGARAQVERGLAYAERFKAERAALELLQAELAPP